MFLTALAFVHAGCIALAPRFAARRRIRSERTFRASRCPSAMAEHVVMTVVASCTLLWRQVSVIFGSCRVRRRWLTVL